MNDKSLVEKLKRIAYEKKMHIIFVHEWKKEL